MRTILVIVVVVVLVGVVGVGAFYAGSNYGFAQAQNIRTEFFQGRQGQGGPSAQGTPSANGTRGTGAQGGQGGQLAGRGVNGTVKSVQGNTMVITERNGSTVTVTINAQTAIQKLSTGTTSDLQPGMNVVVTSNETGSNIAAQTIQIRPSGQ